MVTYTVGYGKDFYPKEPEGDDLHYDRAFGPEGVYYAKLPVDDRVVKVTHKVDDEGRWVPFYAGPHQVVLTVRQSGHSLRYDVTHAVESALWRTRIGRLIDTQVRLEVVNAITKALGMGDMYDEEVTLEIDPEAEKRVKDAVVALLTWAPPYGYDPRLGEIGADVDRTGFATDAAEYARLINGKSDGFGGEGDGKPLPMLAGNEAIYYALAGGKDDGRTLKGLIEELKQAVGVEQTDLFGDDDDPT